MQSLSIFPGTRDGHERYAIRTKSRFEKAVAASVNAKGYQVLLPLYRESRRWCGRNREVELPLFSGYVFARFDRQRRSPILQTPGVVQIVGTQDGPIPLDEGDIQNVNRIVEIGVRANPWPFLREGQVIEVTCGPMAGVRGIFLRHKNEHRLVLSVALLQRAISVEIDAGAVRPIVSRESTDAKAFPLSKMKSA